ncbi:MAG: tetratricopeptide repeat protein [Bacteroidales bacterium]|nr:tetratricopeptide repeat protein [Bacteroidales bacterium]
MGEEFEFYSEEILKEMVERFQTMLKTNDLFFFDIDELSAIIDYYFENGDMVLLEKALYFSLEQYPGNYEFLLKKAQYYALSNQAEKGLDLLDELGNIGDSDFYMTKGSLLSQLQHYREAIEEFTHALNQNHDLIEVYSNIAFEYENLEQYDKALSYLSKVLELEPDNDQTLSEIGLCYEMANRSKEAITFFNKFIDDYPYSKGAWFNLAISHSSVGENEKAIDAYEYVLAIDNEYASAWFNIANIYFSTGDFNQAIIYYSEAIKREDPDVVSYYFLGEAYEQNEMLNDALKNYKKAVSVNVSFIEAYIGLARTYFKLGDLESAYENLAKATVIDEPMPLFWNLRAARLHEQGYGQLARFLTNHLIKINPEDSAYYINKALLSVFDDDYTEALNVITEGLDKVKKNNQKALLFYFKGMFQLLAGNEKKGLADFEFAILLDKKEFENPLLQSELSSVENSALDNLFERYNLKRNNL